MNLPSHPSITRLFTLPRALLFGASLLALGVGLGACDSKSLGEETCKDGETKQVDCNTCSCSDGQWACTEKACDGYDPCEGKACGEGCTACDPDDLECVEDQVIKACDSQGACVADNGLLCLPPTCEMGDVYQKGCEYCSCVGGVWSCVDLPCEPYEPCAGKSCGDLCTICAPDDPDCIETDEIKRCDPFGACTGDEPICEPACMEGEMKMDACNTCGCVDGQWVCTEKACGYMPCLGKACGDGCTICDPLDLECNEDDVIKACDPDGLCVAETPELCEGAYVPCEGKVCGDMCTICAPDDLDCAEDAVIKACNAIGECVPDTMDLCL